MKPLLTPSLLTIALAGFSTSLVSADYNGGQISNGNAAHTGSINIAYNGPDEDPMLTGPGDDPELNADHYNRTGAVELLGDEGSGKSITLEGDIRVSSGADYANVEAQRHNEGVFINHHASNGSITLKTAGAEDRIVIDVYGKGSNGVLIEGGEAGTNNKITLDASSSKYDIEIHNRSSSTESGGGCHLISSACEGSDIEVFGNVNGSSLTNSARGLGGFNGGVISLHGNFTFLSEGRDAIGLNATTSSVVVVDGHLDIHTKGDGAHIVNANKEAAVTVGNGVSATSSGANSHGLLASVGGKIRVNGDVDISSSGTASHGIRSSDKSLIEAAGKVAISTSGENSHGVMAVEGGSVSLGGSASISSLNGNGIAVYSATEDAAPSVMLKDDTVIRSGKSGIHVYQGGSLVSEGYVDIVSTSTDDFNTYGIYAGSEKNGFRAQATLNGASVSIANNKAIVAGGGDIKGNAAQYLVTGNMSASSSGSIDMTMTGRSVFDGAASLLDSTATIDLVLTDDSFWKVTGNSALTNLTLGQGSALQLAFSGSSLTDIISATGTITLEAGSYIYLTGDLSGLEGSSFDFFDGALVNNGVKFVGFDGSDWVEYEYTQTGANTFEFSANAPVVIEEPGFIPEPATATLGLLGLASLMLRRRRA